MMGCDGDGHPLRSLRSRVPLRFAKGTVVLRYGYRLKVWFDGVTVMAQEPGMEYRVMDDGDTEGSPSGEMAVLATPGDRLLSWLVDSLIYVGFGIAGAIVGVVIALVLADDDMGTSFEGLLGVVVLAVVGSGLTMLIWTVFVLFMIARDGQSPGKKLLKVRIVNVDGSDWGWRGTLIREVLGKFLGIGLISGVLGALVSAALGEEGSSIVGLAVMLLLFIWILIDENNQTLHDKIANTYVVKVE